jgi:hypothetical protein
MNDEARKWEQRHDHIHKLILDHAQNLPEAFLNAVTAHLLRVAREINTENLLLEAEYLAKWGE